MNARRAIADPDDLAVETVDSVRAVDGAEWDALAATRTFYLSHAWLRTIEDTAGIAQSYTLVRRSGRLVAAAPAYVWGGRPAPMMTYYDPFEVVAAERTAPDERTRWFPTLLVGARAGFANDVLVADGLRHEDRGRVIDALTQSSLALLDEGSVATASFPYLTSGAARELAPRLRSRGMLVLLFLAQALLELEGTSFDEYVTSLSHSTRSVVKRDLRRAASTGATIGRSRLSACVEEAAVVLHEHHRRYGLPETMRQCRDYLRSQADVLDESAIVFTARRAGVLAGFTVAYAWSSTLYLRVVGIAPEFVRSGLYFALVFHEPAAYALEHGLARLHLGSGSFEAKVRRGARLEPLWAAVSPPPGEETRWRTLLTDWDDRAPKWWRRSLAGSEARP